MKRLYAGVGIFAVVALAAAIWYARARYLEIEASLADARKHAASIERALEERTRVLREETARAEAALQRAAKAEDSADQEARARSEAERLRDEAEARVSEAQAQREAAREQTEQVKQQMAEVRQRRQRELDRMREALNQIAPTHRTASGMVIELANDSFFFDFDKAELRPENREILSRIAGVLLASEGYRLFIYGHTDDIGTPAYNQRLSENRAQSVADYLVQAGVPKDLLKVEGLGQSSPRADNDTRAGREKNRRVEIGIVDSIIEYQRIADSSK